jgi:hypothetical protein
MLCEAVRGNRSLFYDVEQSPLIVVYPSCYDTTSSSLSVRLWIAFYGIVIVMPITELFLNVVAGWHSGWA